MPNKLGGQGLVRFVDTHLDAEIETVGDDVPLAQQVRDVVATSLSEGVPTRADAARQPASRS